MCGIAGILRWQRPPAEAEIQRMTRAVTHRGPDGEGILLREAVALGHRRLAIIDRDGGHQPMGNEDGSVFVTYNGEIYNFRELADELAKLGHRFATRCDTEVIVHAYEQWGDACVERLRGMFAFALADFRRRRMVLARDHFGIKPLFYRLGPGFLAFASELAALREVEGPPLVGDLDAVADFLRFKFIPHPRTIYRDVFKLPPATRMSVTFDGRRSEPTRYWEPRFAPEPGPADEEEWARRCEHVIADSVRAHLVADVPFGVFLSGGIDSTIVAWQMSEALQRPVLAFTIGFEDEAVSELRYAEQAARELGLEWHREVVRPEAAALLPDLLSHFGEPFADSSAIPTWYVSRLARRHVPMVLSGDGGDEAFAGYDHYGYWCRQGSHRDLARMLLRPSGALEDLRQIARRLLRPREADAESWQWMSSGLRQPARLRLWRPEHRAAARRRCRTLDDAVSRAERLDPLSRAQFLDMQTYLPGDILTKVDVTSMYHGLEVRTPLVDREVVEFAARLPLGLRSSGRRRCVLKRLPKRLLARRFPREFVHRPKMGFSIPQGRWLRDGAPLTRLSGDLLRSPRGRVFDFLDFVRVGQYLEMHQAGRDASGVLWPLLALSLWMEQNRGVAFESHDEVPAARITGNG